MSRRTYNWKPVVRSFIERLTEKGMGLAYVDDGGDYPEDNIYVKNSSEATDAICAVDVAWLYMSNPEGKKRWVQFVLGNGPEEIACDWVCDPIIDEVSEEHCKEWEGKPIPLNPISDPVEMVESINANTTLREIAEMLSCRAASEDLTVGPMVVAAYMNVLKGEYANARPTSSDEGIALSLMRIFSEATSLTQDPS